jgi:hypothetical protein
MLATENAREVATPGPERTSAEAARPAERPRSCPRRDICRSLLCQANRIDLSCIGSRKGN